MKLKLKRRASLMLCLLIAFGIGARKPSKIMLIDNVKSQAEVLNKAVENDKGSILTISHYEPAADGNDEYAMIETVRFVFTRSSNETVLIGAFVDLNNHGSLYNEEYVYDPSGALIYAEIEHIEYGNPPADHSIYYFDSGSVIRQDVDEHSEIKPENAVKRAEALRKAFQAAISL